LYLLEEEEVVVVQDQLRQLEQKQPKASELAKLVCQYAWGTLTTGGGGAAIAVLEKEALESTLGKSTVVVPAPSTVGKFCGI
jgi:hypothetical protein